MQKKKIGKNLFSDADRRRPPKTDFRFLIYTLQKTYFKNNNALFFNAC